MNKAKDWIKKSKKRCKYLAIVIILFSFCVPIGYSSFGEAEINTSADSESQTATPTAQSSANTKAEGFQGSGDSVVHAQTISQKDATVLLQEARNTLSGTRLDIAVDQPFQQGNNGFANGHSCFFANVEVIAPQGVFLKDEPLVIEKPDAISVEGPTTSDGGSFRWCITSTQPIQANITVKLANFPQTQTTFLVNFLPTLTITNRTDTASFIFNRPITFTAEIAPWMVQGLKEARLTYDTDNCGAVVCKPIIVKKGLDCSFSGICSATVPESVTLSPYDADSQSFVYTFEFEDTNGNKFQQTNNGSLQFP